MHRYTLITGASRGIGQCFAERLAARGHNLILCARDQGALLALASRLQQAHGVQALPVSADLSAADGVEALLAACGACAVDTLINNAGFGLGQAFAEQDVGRIDAMLQLNIVALTKLTHALLPQLRQHRGNIINVASTAAFQPIPYMAAYAASKAYVLHFSEALAEELEADGVHVLALCPAATATDFFAQANMDLNKTRMRAGRVEDVVDAALAALAKRQRFVVPDLKNRLMSFGVRLLSRRLATKAAKNVVHPN